MFSEAKATAKHGPLERPVQGRTQDDPRCFYPQPVFTGAMDTEFNPGQKETVYAHEKGPFRV